MLSSARLGRSKSTQAFPENRIPQVGAPLSQRTLPLAVTHSCKSSPGYERLVFSINNMNYSSLTTEQRAALDSLKAMPYDDRVALIQHVESQIAP